MVEKQESRKEKVKSDIGKVKVQCSGGGGESKDKLKLKNRVSLTERKEHVTNIDRKAETGSNRSDQGHFHSGAKSIMEEEQQQSRQTVFCQK